MSDQNHQRCLGQAEAARYLGISIRTLATHTRDGMIPSLRLGGRRLYDRRDLEELVERLKKTG